MLNKYVLNEWAELGTWLCRQKQERSRRWLPSFSFSYLSVTLPALPSGAHTWGKQQGNCPASTSLSSCHDADSLMEGPGWEGTLRVARFLDIHQPNPCILQVKGLESEWGYRWKELVFPTQSLVGNCAAKKGQGVGVLCSTDHSQRKAFANTEYLLYARNIFLDT